MTLIIKITNGKQAVEYLRWRHTETYTAREKQGRIGPQAIFENRSATADAGRAASEKRKAQIQPVGRAKQRYKQAGTAKHGYRFEGFEVGAGRQWTEESSCNGGHLLFLISVLE